MLDAIDHNFASGVFRQQDLVAGLHGRRAPRTVLLELAAAHCDYGRLERLLFRAVGDVQSPRGLLLFGNALHQDSVGQWSDPHWRDLFLGTSGVPAASAGRRADRLCAAADETAMRKSRF